MDPMLEQKTKELSKWSYDKDGNLVLEKPKMHGITVTKIFNLKSEETTTIIKDTSSNQELKSIHSGLDKDFDWAPKTIKP